MREYIKSDWDTGKFEKETCWKYKVRKALNERKLLQETEN